MYGSAGAKQQQKAPVLLTTKKKQDNQAEQVERQFIALTHHTRLKQLQAKLHTDILVDLKRRRWHAIHPTWCCQGGLPSWTELEPHL